MSDEHDNDLRAVFARQRGCDHENAPAWHPELPRQPVTSRRASIRWMSVAFTTACAVALTVFLADSPSQAPQLSELPPLFDSPPAELFPNVDPPLLAFEAPSDFLLPSHLNLTIP